jgi:hypothetical protein
VRPLLLISVLVVSPHCWLPLLPTPGLVFLNTIHIEKCDKKCNLLYSHQFSKQKSSCMPVYAERGKRGFIAAMLMNDERDSQQFQS